MKKTICSIIAMAMLALPTCGKKDNNTLEPKVPTNNFQTQDIASYEMDKLEPKVPTNNFQTQDIASYEMDEFGNVLYVDAFIQRFDRGEQFLFCYKLPAKDALEKARLLTRIQEEQKKLEKKFGNLGYALKSSRGEEVLKEFEEKVSPLGEEYDAIKLKGKKLRLKVPINEPHWMGEIIKNYR